MKILLTVVGWFLIIGTLLPLSRRDEWWIRGFDFPRLQICTLQVITLGGYLLVTHDYSTWDWIFITLLSFSLAYQMYMILPYTGLYPKQVEQSQTDDEQNKISLLSTNVLMDNRNASKLKKIIRDADPDIILTLESDHWWQHQMQEFERHYLYTVLHPLKNKYGMHLYSKLELQKPKVKFLVQDDIPSIHTDVLLPSGKKVTLRCLHPRPPFPTGDETTTDRDAELLIVGKEIRDFDVPTIVLGDMNDVAWSRTNYLFQEYSGLLDPRIGRGFYNSFHAKYPFMRFPLDHFFHTKSFRLVNFKRLEYFGSDHFPMYIELSYEAGGQESQEELHTDMNDQKEAEEKIEKS